VIVRVRGLVALGGLCVAALSGCSAARLQSAESASPPAPVVLAPAARTQDVAPPPPPATVTSPSSLAGASREETARASVEVAMAERDLEAATGSCVAACHALGAMDRATGRLCGMVAEADERRVCDDARARLVASRARVRAECGTCPGGPTVDPDAAAPTP